MKNSILKLVTILLLLAVCFGVFPFESSNASDFALTQEEIDYVANKKSVVIMGEVDKSPWEYLDKDKFKGVFPNIVEVLSELTMLDFIYIVPETANRVEYAINMGGDIVSCYSPNADEVSQYSLVLTSSVIKINTDGIRTEFCFAMTKYAGNILYQMISRALESKKVVSIIQASGIDVKDSVPSPYAVFIAIFAFVVILVSWVLASVLKNDVSQTSLLVKDLDELTGLGKKDYIRGCFKHLLTKRNRTGYCFIYIGFGLEQFDRLHVSSDADVAMRHIAASLNMTTSSSDIIARVDNSFVALRKFTEKSEVFPWIDKLFDNIDDFRTKFRKSYSLDVGAGVYFLEQNDKDFDTVLNKAMQGYMYACDRNIRYAVSDKETRALVEQALEDHKYVAAAISNDNFIPYFQPMVDAETNEIVGVEALARWRHPDNNMILSPSRFISMMEDDNTISMFDFFVFERICKILSDRHKSGCAPVMFSCNFSRLTFVIDDFAERLGDLLEPYDFPRELLCIELTENAIVDNKEVLLQNMTFLRDLGITLALDDMGSDYTTVYDFKGYCVNIVKMDKCLSDATNTEAGEKLLSDLIQLAHKLGYTVVCEGIENDELSNTVKEMNCDIIQGYRFYYPMPYEELEPLLQ